MSYLARSFFPGFQLLNDAYAAYFPPNLYLSQTLSFPDGIVWNGGSKSFHNVRPRAFRIQLVSQASTESHSSLASHYVSQLRHSWVHHAAKA